MLRRLVPHEAEQDLPDEPHILPLQASMHSFRDRRTYVIYYGWCHVGK